MQAYKIVYGGQVWVDATTDEEAYDKFFAIILKHIAERSLGIIVESEPVASPRRLVDLQQQMCDAAGQEPRRS